MSDGEKHGWQGIVSAAVVVIATTAAAVSAWSAWQTVSQTQETQLLNRRVEACFEIDRNAGAEIGHALEAVRDAARAQASAEMTRDNEEREWYGDGPSYYDIYGFTSCPTSPAAQKTRCEARLARYRELSVAADRADDVLGVVRFESSRTFTLLGPPSVAQAERALIERLHHLKTSGRPPLAPEFAQLLDAAVAAQVVFREACQTSVGEYSAR